ncbi:pilus assembly protein [Vibrio cincinnatiensis]|jgi:tight adherence protein E|uniref:Tight adherence protein E n=1 Tax=Vibrio cincinnatiensis DSM 19608 TaxID=1123491 RepID=A0A1T4L0N3_VIBCI|nr:TadE family protein [Vibrio cincinnatiensis]MCG3722548.1 pilus assembly protein [Vibrio cincinnatiensis]MCG3725525.1 pilus assembly protein [Vibrio cincinnatiensis]MCG3729731.1 pilus assembly protein [Vibrio cincinnatiensis]MCG3747776.1 pilus assembly protein [Vibrio cincinnatiensis]MCG3765500.1 pilus assembly protein [Vibrio cincinnatiensis]
MKNYALLPKKGIATIEFVGGFFAFWLMCMAWVEMSFISYVSSLGDLAIAKAAREAKKTDGINYVTEFNQLLNEENSLWHYVVDANKFKARVQFVKHLDDLHNYETRCLGEGEEAFNCNDPKDMAIAVYHISYDYQPIFSFFLSRETLFAREVIVIQEYQRETFTH